MIQGIAQANYTGGMKPRQISPQKMDIGAFIQEQTELPGQSPLSEMHRLADSLSSEVALLTLPPITWRAQGRLVPQRVGSPQTWLDLSAQAELPWTCQRCLHPVTLPVSFDRSIRFVTDEALAAQLDADLDEDVLALSRTFDLVALIEDELIMESPVVPVHDQCPVQVKMSVSDPGVDDVADPADGPEASAGKKPNPFAVLAQLKKGGGEGSSDK
jgi:uncharacterized protein